MTKPMRFWHFTKENHTLYSNFYNLVWTNSCKCIHYFNIEHPDPDEDSDVITVWCNTGSSVSPNSPWCSRCPFHSWIRLRRAAPCGGRGADQRTTDLPCSPTATDRPGNGGLSTPKERKQLMTPTDISREHGHRALSPWEMSIKLLTGHVQLKTRSIIPLCVVNSQTLWFNICTFWKTIYLYMM